MFFPFWLVNPACTQACVRVCSQDAWWHLLVRHNISQDYIPSIHSEPTQCPVQEIVFTMFWLWCVCCKPQRFNYDSVVSWISNTQCLCDCLIYIWVYASCMCIYHGIENMHKLVYLLTFFWNAEFYFIFFHSFHLNVCRQLICLPIFILRERAICPLLFCVMRLLWGPNHCVITVSTVSVQEKKTKFACPWKDPFPQIYLTFSENLKLRQVTLVSVSFSFFPSDLKPVKTSKHLVPHK